MLIIIVCASVKLASSAVFLLLRDSRDAQHNGQESTERPTGLTSNLVVTGKFLILAYFFISFDNVGLI